MYRHTSGRMPLQYSHIATTTHIFSNIFAYLYSKGMHFGASTGTNSGVTSKFRITNVDLDFCSYGIYIDGAGTTGQLVNFTSQGTAGGSGVAGVHGIQIASTATNTRLQCSNVRVDDINTNGIRVDGSGSVMFLENIWVKDWNKAIGSFPAIEAASGTTIYVGRARFFEGGSGAAGTGGTGTIILDN